MLVTGEGAGFFDDIKKKQKNSAPKCNKYKYSHARRILLRGTIRFGKNFVVRQWIQRKVSSNSRQTLQVSNYIFINKYEFTTINIY